MNTTKTMALKIYVVAATMAASLAASLVGCQSEATPASGTPTTQPKVLGFLPPPPDKSGAQLWADNCSRCHNIRSPSEFSPRQWEAIVHHMRLRADLTGEEQRKITEFLKASS